MKKFILCAILSCAALQFVCAQKQYVGVQLGFTQPISRLNMPVSGKEKTLMPTTYNGFKVGVVYDATIIKGFGVTMGLNYTFGANSTPWVKKVSSQPTDYPQVSSNGLYHQLEVPVDWQYKFEIAKRTWLMLYTGPTLQCGLSFTKKNYINNGKDAQQDVANPTDDIYSEEDMKDNTLKRLNVTWGIGAGFQYERYFLRGGYDFGLINPYKSQSFAGKDIYTRGRFDQWQIKLGIYLWENNK